MNKSRSRNVHIYPQDISEIDDPHIKSVGKLQFSPRNISFGVMKRRAFYDTAEEEASLPTPQYSAIGKSVKARTLASNMMTQL